MKSDSRGSSEVLGKIASALGCTPDAFHREASRPDYLNELLLLWPGFTDQNRAAIVALARSFGSGPKDASAA